MPLFLEVMICSVPTISLTQIARNSHSLAVCDWAHMFKVPQLYLKRIGSAKKIIRVLKNSVIQNCGRQRNSNNTFKFNLEKYIGKEN